MGQQMPQTTQDGASTEAQPAAAKAVESTKATPASAPSSNSKGSGKGKKGKGKGKSSEAAIAQPTKEAPLPTKEFQGVLKSLSDKNGYGFIVNEEIKTIYERDVWVDSKDLPENCKISARLLFNITLSQKGHPQAHNVRAAP